MNVATSDQNSIRGSVRYSEPLRLEKKLVWKTLQLRVSSCSSQRCTSSFVGTIILLLIRREAMCGRDKRCVKTAIGDCISLASTSPAPTISSFSSHPMYRRFNSFVESQQTTNCVGILFKRAYRAYLISETLR